MSEAEAKIAEVAERTCIITRQQRPEEELIRFVLSPEGDVTPDLKRKLPGRGAWVSKSRVVLAEAVTRRAFAKAFGESAKAAADLPDLVGRLMRNDLVQALSLARKAGLAVAGFTKVEEAAKQASILAVIHVSGAAPDGVAKVDRLCGPGAAVLDFWRSDELDLAFGRENVVHAALKRGGGAQKVLDLALALARFEGLKLKGLN
ncbi:MAG: RNA-binding protein [Pseudomonadota bacterium]|nr:RNA-binding protein [Pseudomonadota bacterium]